ncbi:MAG: hypothetical protein QM765_41205 [Myxococcales bacterium]
MRTLLLAGLCVLFATGCPSGGGVPLEQYLSETYRASCVRYSRCGYFSSEAACNAYFETALGTTSMLEDLILAPVRAGEVRYDGQRARACFEGIAKGSCNILESPEECQYVFEGLVGVGGECKSSECVPDAYCTYATGSLATCPGTCKARVAEGGHATSNAECVRPLVVIDGKCSKPRRAGESCQSAGYECASGLTCSEGTCKAYGVMGQACTSVATCALFQGCIDGTCQAPAGVGQSCSALSSFACKLDLYCDSTAASPTCKERPGEGQACGGASTCKGTLACEVASKTCTRPASVGQSCATVSCDSSGFCDLQSHQCVARLAKGAACTGYDQCVTGTSCSKGTCKSYDECP